MSVMCRPPSVTCHPPSVTRRPSSVTCRPSPVTCRPSSVTRRPPSVTCRPSPVTCRPSSVTRRPPSVTCRPPSLFRLYAAPPSPIPPAPPPPHTHTHLVHALLHRLAVAADGLLHGGQVGVIGVNLPPALGIHRVQEAGKPGVQVAHVGAAGKHTRRLAAPHLDHPCRGGQQRGRGAGGRRFRLCGGKGGGGCTWLPKPGGLQRRAAPHRPIRSHITPVYPLQG